MRAGEDVELVDGRGAFARAAVPGTRRDGLVLDVRSTGFELRPDPWLIVAQAVPKGDRGELAVELATEAGADEIVPWLAERCVSRWSAERAPKALARWRSSAAAAAKQSRRRWWPHVAEPASSPEVGDLLGRAAYGVVLHQDSAESLAQADVPSAGVIVIAVGPEGGIGADELGVLGARGCHLGPTVFRTSSAGAIATAIVAARSGRWHRRLD